MLNHDDEFEEQQTSEKFNEKELPIKPTKLGRQELEIIKKKKTTWTMICLKNTLIIKVQARCIML